MKPLELIEGEREYCVEMRKLTVNRDGEEVFVGLDRAESEWYHGYSMQCLLPFENRDPRFEGETDRYLELHSKHEHARLEILGAEMAARDNPVRH